MKTLVRIKLNAMLEAEAERLCNAGRYERSEARRDIRAGTYRRKLQTQAGEVTLKVPKPRLQRFETAIIERYRRRESSVEEALIEMYLALWGTRVSPSTVSNLNKKIYASIEAWRMRPIEGEHPYIYLDGIVLKRSWAGEVRNVSLLAATSVNGEGYRSPKLPGANFPAVRQSDPRSSMDIASIHVERHEADTPHHPGRGCTAPATYR